MVSLDHNVVAIACVLVQCQVVCDPTNGTHSHADSEVCSYCQTTKTDNMITVCEPQNRPQMYDKSIFCIKMSQKLCNGL